jgi:hypothetical protein
MVDCHPVTMMSRLVLALLPSRRHPIMVTEPHVCRALLKSVAPSKTLAAL